MKPNIDQITKQIRDDLKGNDDKQKRAISGLLMPFNHFVKDAIKKGDFDRYKKMQEEQNQQTSQDEYINFLADVFLEPVLPVDIENPDKYNHIIDKLSKLYIKTYL